MKKGPALIIFLGILLVGQVAFSQEVFLSFKPGSEPEGFRGVKLGTDFSALQGMRHRRTDSSHGGIEFYSTEEDALALGGAKIEAIEYGFWKGKLYVVMITTKGLGNWSLLKTSVFDRFGPGAQAFRDVESYIWEGEKAAMALWYSEETKNGIYYIRSIPMKKEMDAEEK